MDILLAGVAYFVLVFLKAFQQRNVAFLHYEWVLPISYAMAASEILVMGIVALEVSNKGNLSAALPFILAVGTGGGIGCVLSMWIHHRFLTRRPR